MRVIVPMAGAGARFATAGYKEPKPFIEVRGRPMLAWALDPIPPSWDVIAVTRAESVSRCREFARPMSVLTLLGPTPGAAATVLAAAVGLPQDEPVAVMNADQTFVLDLLALQEEALARRWDGVILTFEGTGSRWSYAEARDGIVSRVAEKNPISSHATVGYYWFRRARDLVWACAMVIAQDDTVRGEFYLCPAYNWLIRRGDLIRAVGVEQFAGLGTPEDVEAFVHAG